ncbi:MAG: hypothetical protein ABFS21_06665 [Actinomycetota bacterium]
MKARTLILVAVAVALTVLLASAAMAKKPDHVGKPVPEPTAAPSCDERVNVHGATAWNLGSYDEDSDTYSAVGLPVCIDVTEGPHLYVDPTANEPQLTTMQWTVTLTGEATRFKGVKFVFEQGVHGTVFEETAIGPDATSIDPDTGHYVFDDSLVWTTTAFTPGGEAVSFVAMPRSGDKWVTTPVVTIQPLHNG